MSISCLNYRLSVSLSFVTNDDLVKELDDFTLFSKIYETLDIKKMDYILEIVMKIYCFKFI
jgi:hypothetical protein